MSQYDLVVIGSGPGGYVAAIHAAQSGLDTAIVEKEQTERLGGTCLLRGCIPTKAMLETAELAHKAERADSFGLSIDGAEVDMDHVDAFRDRVVEKSARGVQYLMKKNDIDVHFGHGRIAGTHEVEVTDSEGNKNLLDCDYCILATGSECSQLPSIDMDHERVIDSDELLEMTHIPDHLVVIGGGAVGTEFASCFLRYGSNVTLVELEDTILPIEDAEVSEELERSFEKQGMEVMTSSKVTDVTDGDEPELSIIVETEREDGQYDSTRIGASHLLVAVGRNPVTRDIGLDSCRVHRKENGSIAVDDYMQTDESWVYAIGDIVDSPWLAHVASHEGIVAVDHLADQNPHPIDYNRVPQVTFCSPEVASVGLTEKEAKNKGFDVKTGTFPFSALAKASIVGQTDGFVKIVSEDRYDELLGMHIVGPHATDLITEGTIAMELESTALEVQHTIHPHPTLSESIGEAAHAVLGEPIHI